MMDFKDKNIFGFEIFLKNIPQPNKKARQKLIIQFQIFKSQKEILHL